MSRLVRKRRGHRGEHAFVLLRRTRRDAQVVRQAIVPDRMLGRVQSIAAVLAWSAIPVGAFFGGLAIERTGDVALVYGVIGALVILTALSFSFTALGRAEQYLPEQKEPDRAT